MEQITLDKFIDGAVNYKIKPLIYSMSLTCYKFVCPYCKCDNTYEPPSNKCTECGKIFDANDHTVLLVSRLKEPRATYNANIKDIIKKVGNIYDKE